MCSTVSILRSTQQKSRTVFTWFSYRYSMFCHAKKQNDSRSFNTRSPAWDWWYWWFPLEHNCLHQGPTEFEIANGIVTWQYATLQHANKQRHIIDTWPELQQKPSFWILALIGNSQPHSGGWCGHVPSRQRPHSTCTVLLLGAAAQKEVALPTTPHSHRSLCRANKLLAKAVHSSCGSLDQA